MKPLNRPRATCAALMTSSALMSLCAGPVHAQASQSQLARIEARLAEQDRRLSEQAALIENQSLELRALRAQRDDMLADIRAGQRAPAGRLLAADSPQVVPVSPGGPVGQAPQEDLRTEVAAIPENMGVLTPRGKLIFDPSVEFSRTSNNRLIFRGVEIVPGVQLGIIEASDADRDTLVSTAAFRYGLTNRLEVEARVPYVYRRDQITTIQQQDAQLPPSMTLKGQDFGDLEVAARYQLNDGRNGKPVFVANARVKPPTGRGPYDVDYDPDFGVAWGLATGSGFWAAEAGVTMLYPSDPAVIFAGLTYLHNFSRDIDKTVGPVRVGHVDPGDSIGASLGFGLALNPRFSFSLGYSHNYIFPTESQLGDPAAADFAYIRQKASSLQVGSMQMGWSFRLTERVTLNNNFEFGVTSDAPDMRVVFRAPYRF